MADEAQRSPSAPDFVVRRLIGSMLGALGGYIAVAIVLMQMELWPYPIVDRRESFPHDNGDVLTCLLGGAISGCAIAFLVGRVAHRRRGDRRS